MEPMEALSLVVFTLLLIMFIVASPSSWGSSSSSSASAKAAYDDDLHGYPSSCIATRLEFVFSPSTPSFSFFDDECSSSNNSTSAATAENTAPTIESGAREPDLASVVEPAPPPGVLGSA